jgi:hypothetical protein
MPKSGKELTENGSCIAQKNDWKSRFISIRAMSDEEKLIALESCARTGRRASAAEAAGVTAKTLTANLEDDPDFAVAWEEALNEYRDYLRSKVEQRALEGTLEPIIGGKDRDVVVAHVRRYETQLTMMHARAYVSDYAEKQQVEHSGTTGLLVVGANVAVHDKQARSGNGLLSLEDSWEKSFSGEYVAGETPLPMAPPLELGLRKADGEQ